ncbi:MAG TPA: class I SAM-dependent methyltransferase [Puia sp.]|nr:class I SAM-dependent methyltransferase [Puia sp.]
MTGSRPHPASFRDPAGFVFTVDGMIYRQVNKWYSFRYDYLHQCGLYERLTGQGLMVPYTEGPPDLALSGDAYKILSPLQIRHISYPSEWCPEQLKDAALLTLKVQRIAMENGMGLKDATPLNIQFLNGQPILIDTLSLDLYEPKKPWIAYRQFCECFLFPLYIHRYARTGTGKIAAAWPDGIPVGETARLLPFKSRWSMGAWLHVFLQRRVTSRKSPVDERHLTFSKAKLNNLLAHLQSTIGGLKVSSGSPSSWSNYYDETILGKDYLAAKQRLFRQFLDTIEFADALDLGCNDGLFSKILAESGKPVIAIDSDWQCIDKLYRSHSRHILPLCIDLANPTPATGFRNAERTSFTDRAASDLVTALALIHHLTLANNIPMSLIAEYMNQLAKKYLIVEYVPLSDPKANDLITRRQSRVVGYDPEQFEMAFGRDFQIEKKDPIAGSERVLYLLKKRTL